MVWTPKDTEHVYVASRDIGEQKIMAKNVISLSPGSWTNDGKQKHSDYCLGSNTDNATCWEEC